MEISKFCFSEGNLEFDEKVLIISHKHEMCEENNQKRQFRPYKRKGIIEDLWSPNFITVCILYKTIFLSKHKSLFVSFFLPVRTLKQDICGMVFQIVDEFCMFYVLSTANFV